MITLSEYTLSNVAQVLGAEFSGKDRQFSAVSTDSRKIEPGQLFIALKGPNFDGHDHVAKALEKGAVAAVVDHQVDAPVTQFQVKDTRIALGQLAKARRHAFKGKVVGLTGSNGKTTVKELIASILMQEGKVLATRGNLNNDIGVPLTLLELQNNEQFAVIEMGANHHGEIAYLTQIANPDVALITNAGAAHLEGFGSVEGVANAKAEIYQGLNSKGVAIINLDDQYAPLWLSKTDQYRQIGFGINADAAVVKASNISSDPEQTQFELMTNASSQMIKLPLSGMHNVMNALAAASVAVALGVNNQSIKQGLESAQGVQGRLNITHTASSAIVIDDTYNANLDSVKAGIDVLRQYNGQRILVVGDLFEVGPNSPQVHQAIGEYAKKQGIEELLAIGEMSQYAVQAFGDGGVHYTEKSQMIKDLQAKLDQGFVVLVKGSRGMRMEEIVVGIS